MDEYLKIVQEANAAWNLSSNNRPPEVKKLIDASSDLIADNYKLQLEVTAMRYALDAITKQIVKESINGS